ncbi:hypothetical protein C0J52_14586 [Blattella germanica]|nr:hypothetical protein C0J52_14586 [Blattella germanica]
MIKSGLCWINLWEPGVMGGLRALDKYTELKTAVSSFTRENNRFQVKFSDPKVCKSFLLSCCPHEILSSTLFCHCWDDSILNRMDLGDCPKIHDLALRADFEKASQSRDYYYDIDAMEHLQAFIADCDRRTELAKQRLAETQEELSAEVAQKANKVHELAEQIGKKLARAEQLGAEGFVEESMKLMEEIEDLRKKKSAAEGEYRNSMPASSYQQQKLRVCEKTVEGRKQQKRQEMSSRDRDREREREDRERERIKERDRDRVGSSRDRGRDRHRRSRSRSRSEKRSRSRSKSHSSRSHRSRSSSRSRRSRSRRSRSGERRKDRSRSRDKRREGMLLSNVNLSDNSNSKDNESIRYESKDNKSDTKSSYTLIIYSYDSKAHYAEQNCMEKLMIHYCSYNNHIHT